MKNRGTWLLMVLFFAGLIGLWWADRARIPTRSDRDRGEGRVLSALVDTRPEELRRVEIVGGPEPIVFERREGDRWQMTSPMDVAADPAKVENLAVNLKMLTRRPEAKARTEADPASFGLAPAARTVRLWGKGTDAPLAALDIGRVSLDRRFVRVEGTEAIEAVDARALGLVDLAPIQWRDREVFRVPSFEVDGVTVKAADRKTPLELHRDRDAWRIVEPVRALADGAKLDGLAADLAALRVVNDSRFVADDVKDMSKYGLEKPTRTITVKAGRDGRRRPDQILHVGKPVPDAPDQVYARRDDQDDVIALDERALKGIVADPSAYRDTKVADIDPARVNAFEVEADGRRFTVARYGNDWMITSPQPARADVPAIRNFLKTLDELRTSTFLTKESVPDSGVAPGQMMVRVWQEPLPGTSESESVEGRDRPRLTLSIGRRDAGRKVFYARTDADPDSILALPEGAISSLPRNSLAFRNRLVLAIASDQIDRVSFETEGRTVVLNAPVFKVEGLGKEFAPWWMTQPVASRADMDAVERLLKLLGGMRANSLVADHVESPAEYGFDRPLLKVTCSRPAPSANQPAPRPGSGPLRIPSDELTLLIGKAVPDRLGVHYAMIEGETLVFTVGGEILAVLDDEYHDRRIMSFPIDQASRLDVAWPDRRISFVPSSEAKEGDREWAFVGAIDAPDLDLARAKPLVSALADLKTPRFTQYSGPIPAETGLNPPRAEFRVELAGGGTSPRLRLGNPAGNGQILATTAEGDSGPVFLLPEPGFGAWSKAPRRNDDLPEDVFAP